MRTKLALTTLYILGVIFLVGHLSSLHPVSAEVSSTPTPSVLTYTIYFPFSGSVQNDDVIIRPTATPTPRPLAIPHTVYPGVTLHVVEDCVNIVGGDCPYQVSLGITTRQNDSDVIHFSYLDHADYEDYYIYSVNGTDHIDFDDWRYVAGPFEYDSPIEGYCFRSGNYMMVADGQSVHKHFDILHFTEYDSSDPTCIGGYYQDIPYQPWP